MLKEFFFAHRPIKVDGVKETAVYICSSGTTGYPKGIEYDFISIEKEGILFFTGAVLT